MKYVISLTITTPNIEGDSSRITYMDNLPSNQRNITKDE